MPLSLLHNARQTLQRFAPDFAKLLTELPFEQREAADSPVVDWFKHTGPVALLVPKAGLASPKAYREAASWMPAWKPCSWLTESA